MNTPDVDRIVRDLIESATPSKTQFDIIAWYEQQCRALKAEMDVVLGIAATNALENFNLKREKAALRAELKRYRRLCTVGRWVSATAGWLLVIALLVATYFLLQQEGISL